MFWNRGNKCNPCVQNIQRIWFLVEGATKSLGNLFWFCFITIKVHDTLEKEIPLQWIVSSHPCNLISHPVSKQIFCLVVCFYGQNTSRLGCCSYLKAYLIVLSFFHYMFIFYGINEFIWRTWWLIINKILLNMHFCIRDSFRSCWSPFSIILHISSVELLEFRWCNRGSLQ